MPIPAADNSVLSDGRILKRPLDKVCCHACRLVRHRVALDAAEVEAIYATGYELPLRVGSAENGRGAAYAAVVDEAVGGIDGAASFLDVGCGSGAMLRALLDMSRNTRLCGVDPALPRAVVEAAGRLTMRRGSLAAEIGPGETFDAIASVNTIEHTADPVAFLSQLRSRLRASGRIAVICPAASPANCELLFFDHLWTITPLAMRHFAEKAKLRMASQRLLEGPLAGFQLFVLDNAAPAPPAEDFGEAGHYAPYLEAWGQVDRQWEAELGVLDRPVQAFGAGQMAALFRAYAPETWKRVARLVVDNPDEAWPLAPVARYEAADHSDGWITLIAVHPGAQRRLADRIRDDGGRPVTLPSSIRA